MSVLRCPLCSSEYVGTVRDCVDCQVALVDPDDDQDPRRAPEDEQVVYELGEWSLDRRVGVAEAMAHSGIPHAWEGEELIVHERYESAVDRLLEPFDPDDEDEPAVPMSAFLEQRRISGESDEAEDFDDVDGVVVDGGDGSEPETLVDDAADAGIVEYDLAEWELGQRADLVSKLVEAGVPHRWDGTSLLVGAGDEAVVDDMLDDMEAGGDDAALEDDGQETPFEVLEALFLASDRLAHDQRSRDGQEYLLKALEGMDEDRPPFGVDLVQWRRIVALADDLADHVEGETMDLELAADDAGELRRMLRNFV